MIKNKEALPKVALVTGGAKRIGRALVRRLVDEKFAVAIHYHHSHEAAEKLLKEIHQKGGKACLLQGDLSQKGIAEQLIKEACQHLGEVGLLVNNASVFEGDLIETVSEETWEKHLRPNVTTPLFLTQAFAKQLTKGKKGMVLNLLDHSILKLPADFISYTVSKSALWTLTQTLALALAPSIRVNGIAPGAVLIAPRQTKEHFEKMWKTAPLESKTTPEEIAEAMMAFLNLPSVTGQVLVLDGGQHLK
ncbi:SDR family oxidoreductase [Acetobacteraceae bacterium]|nr:SDR family oxidoreductase [Acetobacteraceae bacterium]